MSFKKKFIICQVVLFIPALALVRYLESIKILEDGGLSFTIITTFAFSMLPAVFIAAIWWNMQDDE